MAGRTRHLKEKDGRFYARLAVPAALKPAIGRSELVTPLGADRRVAMRLLPEAVAALHRQLDAARPQGTVVASTPATRRQLTNQQLAALSYNERLKQDTLLRETSPGWAQLPVDTDYAALLRDGMAGRLNDSALNDLVGNRIAGFKARGYTEVKSGTPDWRRLAMALCVSEYEALERIFERDEGRFDATPSHPLLKSLDEAEMAAPVDLMELWDQYVAKRQKEGSMQDGGRRQILAVKSLINFTKKSDATELTRKDISDWQDYLMDKISA